MAGTADPQVPYLGGTVAGSTVQIPPVETTMGGYADHYHCTVPPSQELPLPGVMRQRYDGCVRGTLVVLDTVVGGTHEWPGGAQAENNPMDSASGKQFDATSEILDLFDSVP
ncbi:MAG TPA: hypothetical protein VGJ03_15550 [Acidimicrobiales bacterium]